MEIDKTLVLSAPPQRVWALLLDPQALGGCVPGMESVQVISDDEYAAVMKVKVSFVSARFKLRTRIVERDAPRYLRAEGTGEDSAVASSLKQVSEMWLDGSTDGSSTTLRLKVQVDVLGRIGSFGLAAMKTKADRLWDEFGVNLAARLAPATETPATAAPPVQEDMPDTAPATPLSSADATVAESTTAPAKDSTLHAPILVHGLPASTRSGFWQRLFGGTPEPIRVELRRGDTHLVVSFPVEAADACTAWLRTLSEPPR